MQLGLQVALLSAGGCAAWTCNVRQAETIEQNNQMLSSLGTLDTKVDSVSSKVDSVSSSVHDIAGKQDSLNKQVGSPLSRGKPERTRVVHMRERRRSTPCCNALAGMSRKWSASNKSKKLGTLCYCCALDALLCKTFSGPSRKLRAIPVGTPSTPMRRSSHLTNRMQPSSAPGPRRSCTRERSATSLSQLRWGLHDGKLCYGCVTWGAALACTVLQAQRAVPICPDEGLLCALLPPQTRS